MFTGKINGMQFTAISAVRSTFLTRSMILLTIISPVLFWQATLPRKKVCMTQPSTAPATVKLRIMLIQAATVSTKPLRPSAIPKPILRTIRAITSNSLPQTIRTRWNSTEAVQSLQPRSIWQALTRLPRPISNITKKMVCTIASRVCRKATRSIWTAPITNSWHSRTF